MQLVNNPIGHNTVQICIQVRDTTRKVYAYSKVSV